MISAGFYPKDLQEPSLLQDTLDYAPKLVKTLQKLRLDGFPETLIFHIILAMLLQTPQLMLFHLQPLCLKILQLPQAFLQQGELIPSALEL